MYCITDQQVDYILDDIRRNGIELEDLQLNLLDHICCIIEQGLKENDDFERFYHETVKQFYTRDLHEIEEETIYLLTFKNYYTMKKIMMASGAVSVIAFIIGSFFKIMHWEGTSFFLLLAMFTLSFLFLPLMAVLKIRERVALRDKLVTSIGVLVGILYTMSTLFAIEHWAGRTVLWLSTVSVSMFVLIPVYFFTGIRKPETKANTIVTSILMVGGTGLIFSLIFLKGG